MFVFTLSHGCLGVEQVPGGRGDALREPSRARRVFAGCSAGAAPAASPCSVLGAWPALRGEVFMS